MTLAAFVSVALIHLLAVMSPGPSFVLCIRTAASEGFGTAVALALGFGAGAVIWAVAAMAGLALLFDLLPTLLLLLKLAGAAFLLLIAVAMWRHARDPLPLPETGRPRSPAAAIRLGLLTFLANPKPAVFFGAIFVGLVPPETPVAVRLALLAVIFVDETLWYVLVARLFSMPRARGAYLGLKAWIDRGFGTLIAAFGLKIALT